MSYRVINGCPVNSWLAPYLAILVEDTGAHINSLYRGDDKAAVAILHAHGHHTQRELYATMPPGVANPPGRSTHELRSDGVAYAGPVGRRLRWWQQGIDVNDGDVHNMIVAAARRGWALRQPYKAGIEFHHLNFARPPRPMGPATVRKIVRLRLTLPRR